MELKIYILIQININHNINLFVYLFILYPFFVNIITQKQKMNASFQFGFSYILCGAGCNFGMFCGFGGDWMIPKKERKFSMNSMMCKWVIRVYGSCRTRTIYGKLLPLTFAYLINVLLKMRSEFQMKSIIFFS